MFRAGMLLLLSLAVSIQTAQALTGRVIISSASVSELDTGTQVDVLKNLDCNRDGAATLTDDEPFLDTKAHLKVVNGLNRTVRITRFWYRVKVGGKVFTSRKVGIIGGGYVASDTEQEILSLFAHAKNNAKYLIRSATPIPADTGIRNVTFYLSGDDGAGRSLSVRTSTVVNFTDVDRCG